MVLVGLLLLALIFVVVGVVLANVGWLIASLVVSVLAAGLLLRSYLQNRRRIGAARPAASTPPDAPVAQPAAPSEPATAAVPRDAPVWVVDGHPEYHVESCTELEGLPAEAVPYEQAVEDGFQPCVVCNPDRALLPAAQATPAGAAQTQPDRSQPAAGATPPAPDPRQVLVIDGFPDYHVAGCRLLLGHDSVSIPVEQAIEDGFAECAVCMPSNRAEPAEVWVVDGYPDYHRADCSELRGLPAEAIPHEQAVEDGFAECAVCMPSNRAEPAEVWVVDGFPDYHRADCGQLHGLTAEAIPREQAVEDGFAPCAICQYADGQVWVVDGHPEYHRTGCESLSGLPGETIPYHQAVEDGFVPCPVCRPDEESEPPAQPESDASAPQQ